MNQLNHCENVDFDNTYNSNISKYVINEAMKVPYNRVNYNNGIHTPDYSIMYSYQKSKNEPKFYELSVNFKSKYDTNISDTIQKDFYNIKNNLLHIDNIGLNRFYNLQN